MTETKIVDFDTLLGAAIAEFRRTFADTLPTVAAIGPGRVNLIGEHIDYNDGFVLPMALPMVTVMVGRRNGTRATVNLLTMCESADGEQRTRFDTGHLEPGQPKWANYVKGVIKNFGVPVAGFDAVIATSVPIGGGLSSSAALEVATLTFCEAITGHSIAKDTEKALICQRAEHEYAGMPCGIMDQFVSVMGRRGHALLIDCRLLTAVQIPFVADALVVLVCNSNVRHRLSDSEYPTRRAQCRRALELMQLDSYRDASLASLKGLDDATLLKRARHVITEMSRTVRAADALKCGDFIEMGKLMTASHASLRDDFEVSCRELDYLVAAALECPGVLGSRMTGGGFGGCTVTLAHANTVHETIDIVASFYKRVGGTATFFISQPSDGARLLDLTEHEIGTAV